MKKRWFLVIMVIGLSMSLGLPAFAGERTEPENVQALIANEISQDSLIQITIDLMSGDVGPIGNRIYNPRTQGTPNGDRAIATALSYFESWGVDEVEVWTNPNILNNRWYLKTWEITSPRYTFLPEGNWPCRNSPANNVSGQLIYVGAGTSASNYTGLDVAGKIVLADGTASSAYNQAVIQRGAIGLIKISARGSYYPDTGYDTHPYSSEVTTVYSITYSATNTAPAISISWDDGANLKALLATGDVTINLMVDTEFFSGVQSKSVIATINGTIPGPYMILYGHLDSDSYGPGCDDNASGVASIMEIARVMQTLINQGKILRPTYSVKFFLIGSELSDSRAYLDSMTDEQLAQIIGGINFDQAGLGVEHDRQNIEATDRALSQELLLICKDIIDEYQWEDYYQFIPYLGGTDHVSFLNKGLPTIYIWTDWTYRAVTNPPEWGGDTVYIAGNPYYHSSGDTVENTILGEPWNMVSIATMAALVTSRFVDFQQVIGFLPPLETGRSYKAGSTIPVKFQLKNAIGDYVSDAIAEIYVDGSARGSSGSSNTLNFFRYDPADDQYIFNLNTKGMSLGWHTIEVKLDNGETILATTIVLR